MALNPRITDWQGRPWHETVLYELHAGLLGGFAGVERRLADLAALGRYPAAGGWQRVELDVPTATEEVPA